MRDNPADKLIQAAKKFADHPHSGTTLSGMAWRLKLEDLKDAIKAYDREMHISWWRRIFE